MRKTIVVSALLLALASPALAGDMQNDKPQPAPSTAQATTKTVTAPILTEIVYVLIAALRVVR